MERHHPAGCPEALALGASGAVERYLVIILIV